MRSEPNLQDTGYASAEFKLDNPGVFFLFKLRCTESEPLFALVNQGSRVLESIKAGDVIPVTFHFPDKTIPAEKKDTRIKYIEDGSHFGFKDHLMVALDPE